MADKKEKVAALKQLFADSSAIYLTEYRGLTVTELKTLRRSMTLVCQLRDCTVTSTRLSAPET